MGENEFTNPPAHARARRLFPDTAKVASPSDEISLHIFVYSNVLFTPQPVTFARRIVIDFCPAELTCLSIILCFITREHAGYDINIAWNESVK